MNEIDTGMYRKFDIDELENRVHFLEVVSGSHNEKLYCLESLLDSLCENIAPAIIREIKEYLKTQDIQDIDENEFCISLKRLLGVTI